MIATEKSRETCSKNALSLIFDTDSSIALRAACFSSFDNFGLFSTVVLVASSLVLIDFLTASVPSFVSRKSINLLVFSSKREIEPVRSI